MDNEDVKFSVCTPKAVAADSNLFCADPIAVTLSEIFDIASSITVSWPEAVSVVVHAFAKSSIVEENKPCVFAAPKALLLM